MKKIDAARLADSKKVAQIKRDLKAASARSTWTRDFSANGKHKGISRIDPKDADIV